MGIATQIQDGLQFIESPLKINHLQGTTSTTILQVHKPAAGTPSLNITGNLKFEGDSRYIDLAKGTTNSQPFIRIGEQNLYGFSMRWDSGSHVQFDGWWNSSTGGSANRDFGSLDINNRIWKLEGGLTLNGNTVWHAGNDGSGSGLDADTVDGFHVDANSGGLVKSYQDVTTTFHSGVSSYRSSMGMVYASDGPNSGNDWYRFIQPSYREGSGSSNVWQTQLAFYGTGGDFWLRQREGGNFGSSGWGSWCRVWTSNTDGSGTGLDADTLDGVQGASFLRSDEADSAQGAAMYVFNRPTPSGYQTALRVGTEGGGLFLTTNNAIIGKGAYYNNGWIATSANGCAIDFASNEPLIFSHSGATAGNSVTMSASTKIWHAGNDGSGSTLDADLLDGQQGTYYRGGAGLGQNINYVASSTSTSNRGNHGQGVWAYSGYSTGSNRPYVYDATLQVMPTTSLGFELSTSWHSTGEGTLKIRALRDCCEGWGSYYDIWSSANDGSGSGLDADTVDGIQGASLLRSDADDSYAGNLTVNGMTFKSDSNVSRNFKIQPSSSTTDVGISAFRGDGVHSFQLYGTNTQYGFLDGNWASWDVRKTKNGALHIDEGSGLNRVLSLGSDGAGSGLDADTVDGVQASAIIHGNNTSGTNEGTITNWNNVDKSGFYSDDNASNSWTTGWTSIINHRLYDNDNNYHSQIGFGTYTAEMYFRGKHGASAGWSSWYEVWHSGVDGSGSGLDADTLDGIQGASFLRSDAADTASGNLTFTGNISQTSGVFLSHGDQTGNVNTVWQAAGTGKDRGIYPFRYQSNASNAPATNDNANWGLNIYSHAGSGGGYPYGIQLAGANAGSGENSLFLRTVSNGTFGSWKRVFHEGHLPTMAEAGVTTATVEALGFLRSNAADTATGQLFFDAGFDSHPIMLSGAQNFDNIDRSGFYNLYNTASGSTNSPPLTYGTMIVIGNDKGSQGFGLQIAHERTGAGMYVRGMNDSGSTWYDWHEIWTSGTDGSGSGLDADTLDGLQASAFVQLTANQSISGTKKFSPSSLVIEGTHGTISFLDTTSGADDFYLHVNSNNFYVLANRDGNNVVDGAYETPHPLQLESDTNTAYTFGNRILTTADEGSGNGLDADTVDGVQGSSFLRSDVHDSMGTDKILEFPNSAYSRSLKIGAAGNLSTTTVASIGVTNGNLHIDSASGHATYLNFYDGTSGVAFGSGNVTAVAWMGPDGDLWKGSSDNSGSKYWHAGNDGAGTGLDADTVDGHHAAQTYTSTGNAAGSYLGGHYSSGGNEKPNAGTFGAGKLKLAMLSSSNLGFGGSWNDVLWLSAYNGSDVKGSHALVFDKYSNNVYVSDQAYDSTSWGTGYKLWHAGNDGSGSGLDADTLDGLNVHNTQSTQNSANTILRTQVNGYTMLGWINTTSGDMTSTLQDRIYCSNDGYIRYVDLASFRARMNVTAKTGYQGRESSTTDTSYWVGAMGWGTTDFNDIFHYGSGTIDSWSSPGNQPSTATSHWVGSQHLHYTNGTNAYGHQILVGAGSPSLMYVRGRWGTSFTSWSQMWNSSNDGAGSGLDADTLDGMQPKSASGQTGSEQVLRSASNGYFYHKNWTDVDSAGLFSTTTNGAHFYPNAVTSHGAWRMNGTRGGYNGIVFDTSSVYITLMANGTTMGFYNASDGEWMMYANRNSGCYLFFDNSQKLETVTGGVNVTGTMTASADVVAYSDERLKSNIETLDGSKVYEMRGVSFTKDEKDGSGVIAQELEKVAPELVNNDSEFKSVAYGNITGYLIEAIKDLKQEIEELKKQIK